MTGSGGTLIHPAQKLRVSRINRKPAMSATSTLIETNELTSILGNGDTRVVDCRFSLADPDAGRRDFLESHVPGAVYAHLDEDLSDLPNDADLGRHPLPSVGQMEATFRRLGIDNGDRVVAYDDSGGAIAARLWWMLRFLGHESVSVLNGGWRAWLAEGGAVSNEIVRPEPGTFEARPGSMPIADVRDVLRGLDTRTITLIDARDEMRYTGEDEPIDPVAGHIPGARSVPYKQNLDPTGRFLDRAALRDRFEDFHDPGKMTVSYCGSGVTACHNILAMEHAGLQPAALFPPSWSGWIADPERPLEGS